MSSEPTYPKDAAIGAGAEGVNETLSHALTAKQAEEASAADKEGGRTRTFVRGAAVGIGSAALVAALLYANRSRRPDKND